MRPTRAPPTSLSSQSRMLPAKLVSESPRQSAARSTGNEMLCRLLSLLGAHCSFKNLPQSFPPQVGHSTFLLIGTLLQAT